MKVKELLEFLKDINPEDDVITFDPDEGCYYTCTVERYKGCIAIEHFYGSPYNQVKWPEDYVEE